MLKVQDMCEIYLEGKKFREIELAPLIFLVLTWQTLQKSTTGAQCMSISPLLS